MSKPIGSDPQNSIDAETERFSQKETHIVPMANTVVNGSNPAGISIGDRFQGKYEILCMLGAGGMGQVYQARHLELGTMAAIKVLHKAFVQDDNAIERFKREARASAKIVHPNAVRVFDYGVHQGTCYLVMEYLEGESLRKRLASRRRLSLSEAIQFVEQVCYVLESMHRKGIIHRDLKPDNIFFNLQEDAEVVKVLDFGLVKLSAATHQGDQLTQPGSIIGTPHYMSPEQCQTKELDGRSDLYSLGVIAYEILSGRVPFNADNYLGILYKQVNEPPQPLHEVAPDIPLAVSDAVMRLLAKNPADRFQSAKEFLLAFCEAASIRPSLYLEMLEKIRPEAVASNNFTRTQTAPLPDVSRWKLQKKIAAIAAATLALAGLIGSAYYFFGRQPTQSPTQSVTQPANPSVEPPTSTATSSPLGDDFVLIPGGTIVIGRNPADCANIPECKVEAEESPAHTVTLARYFLSKHEVTSREYKEFITDTGRKPPKTWNGQNYLPGAEDLPVTYVTWNDASEYCRWRKERDGIDYRLPTEEEWEYAARGDEGRLYPWGYTWDNSYANANKPGSTGPLPINKAPNNTEDKSPFGIFAMAGNVMEWTSSNFSLYPGSGYKTKGQDRDCKIYRGGSFLRQPDELRTSYRLWDLPDHSSNELGFRLAATPPKK